MLIHNKDDIEFDTEFPCLLDTLLYSMEMFHRIKISKRFEKKVRCLFLGPVSEQLPKIQFSTRHVPRYISWIIGKVWKNLNCRSIFCTKHFIIYVSIIFFIKFKVTVYGIRNTWYVLFPTVPWTNLSDHRFFFC